MKTFFGLPSDIEKRVEYFNNIWEKQVLLSKTANIAIDLSDEFSEYQFNKTFDAIEHINKLQQDYIDKQMEESL